MVDDDEDIRNLVRARLRAAGHLAVAVRSGPEVSMPGMTGFDLLRSFTPARAWRSCP